MDTYSTVPPSTALLVCSQSRWTNSNRARAHLDSPCRHNSRWTGRRAQKPTSYKATRHTPNRRVWTSGFSFIPMCHMPSHDPMPRSYATCFSRQVATRVTRAPSTRAPVPPVSAVSGSLARTPKPGHSRMPQSLDLRGDAVKEDAWRRPRLRLRPRPRFAPVVLE